ncbi:hypothetical protein BANRA_05489 [Klebsiella pneumoniae]|nr:hypothetical protein BANRA_05489 [Klebsiella pneumoniae]
MTDITTPSVYVGTYHKYNCGSIAGAWLDLTDFDSSEEFYERCRELHANEADPEFMFQDWEGIPSGMASECHINWDFINGFKQAREEGNEAAFVAFVDLFIALISTCLEMPIWAKLRTKKLLQRNT